MAIDILLQETKGLSDEALMEIVRFVRFMKSETSDISRQESENHDSSVKPVRRKGGKYRGQGWMASDFNAPMEEFREYM